LLQRRSQGIIPAFGDALIGGMIQSIRHRFSLMEGRILLSDYPLVILTNKSAKCKRIYSSGQVACETGNPVKNSMPTWKKLPKI
jgi:hypothetical protein